MRTERDRSDALRTPVCSFSGEDAAFMRAALREAERAFQEGEVPVGAVIVREGRILGRGRNRPIRSNDPTAHAEIRALRAACRREGNYRLPGAVVYTTLEPCPMCCGALMHARVARVVYATRDPKGGGLALFSGPAAGRWNHHLVSVPGPGEADSAGLLREFFRRRRVAGHGEVPKRP